MLNARRAYSAWSSSTTGGASVRAASAIALGGLPTATRASSRITLRRRELRSRRNLIERQRTRAQRVVERRQTAASATLVCVIRTAVRWSLLETCASHCALDEQPAARQSPSIVGRAHELA